MKLRVSLQLQGERCEDITIASDVTATVGDAARTLIRAGATVDPHLERISAERLAPVTLLGRAPDGDPVLLDPMAPISASGLHSGWTIRPVLEFGEHGRSARAIAAVGTVEVVSGAQRAAKFSLVAGENLIGRDHGCRIHLLDRSVSRRHAEITVDATGRMTIRDLGSANGTLIEGRQVGEGDVDAHPIAAPTEVRLGEVELRIIPHTSSAGSPASDPTRLSSIVAHTRSPRVAPTFPNTRRELPQPPTRRETPGLPMLAMLAPALIGVAMYVMTRSAMSLVMVAFSPVMLIGSWLDGTLSGRRSFARDLARFRTALDGERAGLAVERGREIRMRASEAPTLEEVGLAIAERGRLMWTRRPEHPAFLELRFGEGALPSRTELALPPRGEASTAHWGELTRLAEQFGNVGPVPVVERLGSCGAIGVSGERSRAEALARALILQLVALHSPSEVALCGFAHERHHAGWGWLKWLPHIDPVGSPIAAWQLADSLESQTALVIGLEALLEARRSSAVRGTEGGRGVALPAVIVLVLDADTVDRARLIELAEAGPDVGIHLIWVADDSSELPAACRTYVELGCAETVGDGMPGHGPAAVSDSGRVDAPDGRVCFVRSATVVPLSRVEHLDAEEAWVLARRLAPVEDAAARRLDESDLPRAVDLRELHGTDLLGGPAPIQSAWAASGSLVSHWWHGEERPPLRLAATVGQGAEAPAVIDLRLHGPHALVGGTTGAGKSEFLQSWIMSLAATIGPERLTFLLVDYKGGAAFAECVDLPHTVGLVTDLGPHLVRRALTSLRAELHHRERLLAEHGAKDLITMERRSDAAAPPVLVIVIDEFAALAAEVPEFVDGVIDVAQRGRSLGLHLVMATQRPAGVITDNLRANTNLRIALRMADESDSRDVIGAPDATFFDAETPGRGAIKVGPGRILHFQTGYLGGRASDTTRSTEIEVRTLGLVEGPRWEVPDAPRLGAGGARRPGARRPARDIERLRDGIVEAARLAGLPAPRRPWLDQLPQRLELGELRLRAGDAGAPHGDAVLLGLRDDPAVQAQHPVLVDFDEVGGIALLGAGGTGKTSALITLAASLSVDADRHPVQIYAIDAAGGALDALSVLPTVGGVAPLGDAELVDRMLRHLSEIVAERGPRFAAERAGDLTAYRRLTGRDDEARVVLLLDGFAAFRQAAESLRGGDTPFERLNEIMLAGRAVGVHVVLTVDRPLGIPASMSSALQQQFVFRLGNANDYGFVGVSDDILTEAPPGRAVQAGDTREIQFALVSAHGELSEQAAAIERIAADLNARGAARAPMVAKAPTLIRLHELPVSSPHDDLRPVYGIDTRDFSPIGLPLNGLCVVAGPSGSGLSSAALSCRRAIERWAGERGEEVDAVLLSLVESGLAAELGWSRIAIGERAVAELAAELTRALGGKPADSGGLFGGSLWGDGIASGGEDAGAREFDAAVGQGGGDSAPVFPRAGARGLIVVERAADAEDTDAVPHLVALAKAARRSDALVLFEFETGRAAGVWELFVALKQPKWGLSLQPDHEESQTPFREDLGRVKRTDFPPGRGFAVEAGRVVPIHVAFPGAESHGELGYSG